MAPEEIAHGELAAGPLIEPSRIHRFPGWRGASLTPAAARQPGIPGTRQRYPAAGWNWGSISQLRGDGWVTIDVSRADRSVYSGTKAVKNDERKTLPLPEELAEWIDRWVPRERRLQDGLLFVNPNTGGPWSETVLRRTWYKACEQVGGKVSLYTGTKHSTATELRRQGVPLDVIQALVEAIRRPRSR